MTRDRQPARLGPAGGKRIWGDTYGAVLVLNMARARHLLLWLDLETTGTDDRLDSILELAVTVTDDQLTELGTLQTLVRPSQAGWDRLLAGEARVREMHQASGLLADLGPEPVGNETLPVTSTVEAQVLALLDTIEPGARAELAGSGVDHFDRGFLQQQMPTLHARLKFWSLDTGVLRRTYLKWVGRPLTNVYRRCATHRAAADVAAALAEAGAFREVFATLRPPQARPADVTAAERMQMALTFIEFDRARDDGGVEGIATVADEHTVMGGLVDLAGLLLQQSADERGCDIGEVVAELRAALHHATV